MRLGIVGAGGVAGLVGAALVKATRNPYSVELATFAATLRGGPRFHVDARDGARCVELTDALLAATAES
jgi:ketopantoate reductase